MFIQCYVFLINCGLSLVFIYVSGRFSPAFNLVILTVSSSDAQCEICFPQHFCRSEVAAVPQVINSNVSPSRKPVKPFSPTHSSCVFSPCHSLAEDSILHPPVISGQKEQRRSGRSTLVFSSKCGRKAMCADGVSARELHGQNFQLSCQICFLRAAGSGEMSRSNWLVLLVL